MWRIAYLVYFTLWWNTWFYCVQQVETGGEPNPSEVVGDNGRSIGPMQISYNAWLDATQYDKNIGGAYEDCKNYEYASKIAKAYVTRWGIDKGVSDPIKLARIFNGGPKGHIKQSTVKYARKFNEYWEQFYVVEQHQKD